MSSSLRAAEPLVGPPGPRVHHRCSVMNELVKRRGLWGVDASQESRKRRSRQTCNPSDQGGVARRRQGRYQVRQGGS